MNTVILQNYPQLKTLLWNRKNKDTIEEAEAFALYEGNWKHVDVQTLTEIERQFIQQLVTKYGHGILNV